MKTYDEMTDEELARLVLEAAHRQETEELFEQAKVAPMAERSFKEAVVLLPPVALDRALIRAALKEVRANAPQRQSASANERASAESMPSAVSGTRQKSGF